MHRIAPRAGIDFAAQTVYVRAAGSDDNDGTSEANAVATLRRALNLLQAPPIEAGDAYTHTINMEAGATFPLGISFGTSIVIPWVGKLRIVTSSPGTNAILSAPAGAEYGLFISRSRVTLDGITIQPANTSNRHQNGIKSVEDSVVTLRGGTLITGALTREVFGLYGGRVDVRSDASLVAGISTAHGLVVHSHVHADLAGNVSGYDRGVYVDRGASATVFGSAIVDGCTYGVYCEDNAEAKSVNGARITNCATGAFVTTGSLFSFEGAPVLTGTTKAHAGSRGGRVISTGSLFLSQYASQDGHEVRSGNVATDYDLADFPELTNTAGTVRLFRKTTTTGNLKVQFCYGDGTGTALVIIDAKTGELYAGGQIKTPQIVEKVLNEGVTIPRLRLGSGATGSRPATPATGFVWFDTTLGKPIWYNGTAWVDATGASV